MADVTVKAPPRSGTRRAGRALAVCAFGAICAMVLALRVHTGLPRERFRIVTEPLTATAATISVPLPDLRALSGEPAALILRLGGSPDGGTVRIVLDGAPVAEAALPPAREIRIDAPVRIRPEGSSSIRIAGDRDGWSLAYLEVANVYGFSEGLVRFLIVPRERTTYPRVPLWGTLAVLALLLALRPDPAWPSGRGARIVHRAGVGLVLLLFLATLVTDVATKYKLLLSVRTFALGAAVVYAQRVVQGLALAAALTWPLIRASFRTAGAASLTLSRVARWPRLPAFVALTTALASAGFAHLNGTHIAGGADSYGYVSQAELWAQGRLHDSAPIVADLPAYLGEWVASPLGYTPHRAAGIRGQIVPTYAPGLPLLMAAFRIPFGFDGVFLVVPLLSGLTVWLTFVLGRQLDGAATGCVAACWLATTPAFVMSSVTPMSDVPAAAFWTAALAAAGGSGRWWGLLAGISTALAILTRPNLAPLAALIAAPLLWRAWQLRNRAALVNLSAFGLTAAAGAAAVGALFNYWYGSPLSSGYGSFEYLFSVANIAPNLQRYPRWLVSTATALSAAALLAPVVLVRERSAQSRRAWWLFAFCGLVWCAYLLYIPFESWDYLRFLLPAYPAQFVLASAALVALTRRTLAPRLLTALLLVLLVSYGARYHNLILSIDLATLEARYRRVGEFVRTTLPGRAVLLSMQHSGSLRLYGHREILRVDILPAQRLEDILQHLEARGYQAYFVLDDWEEDDFRERYAARTPLGRLDWTPIAVAPGPTPVAIYDPRDRASGRTGVPRVIP